MNELTTERRRSETMSTRQTLLETAHLCYTHASQKRLDFEFESDVGRREA